MIRLKYFMTVILALNFAKTSCQSCFHTTGTRKSKAESADSIPCQPTDLIQSCDTITTTPNLVELSRCVAFPLENINITSLFGVRRDPLNRKTKRIHSGIDLKAHFENVYSMLPGIVERTGYSKNGGFFVTLVHGNCICTYLHLSQIRVNEGMHVSAGDIVATSGCSGVRCTGPHLHISCRWQDDSKGKYFNPIYLLEFIANKLRNN